jgi:DNA helicase-2/ATP-dependent DNA helicase PcrA
MLLEKLKQKNHLNDQQLAAVLETENPVLVLSGAGTGKTRVITYKIAYLVSDLDYQPDRILAMTFTNKAASEMEQRAHKLIGSLSGNTIPEQNLWIGTFHSNCSRMLRTHAGRLGFTSNFSIVDQDDKIKILKELIKEKGFKHLGKVSQVNQDISRAKNNFLDPADIIKKAEAEGDPYYLELGELYTFYQQELYRNNGMDFDDLIVNVVKIFYMDPEIRAFWQKKFDYILVDEFQDTNKSQYLLLKLLMREGGGNLTLVGDDDQSIYSFRGATVDNIRNLPLDFENLKIIRVVKNYRSTPEILDIANEAIGYNTNRLGKELEAIRESMEIRPVVFYAEDDRDEAKYIVQRAREFYEDNPEWKIGVIYRTNAQSRVFENSLMEHQLPYAILGAKSFYDRREVKDLIAYFRLILNPKDNVALKRIINAPTRGIGQVTVNRLEALAREKGTSMLEAIGLILEGKAQIKVQGKILNSLKDFYLLITELEEVSVNNPKDVLKLLLDATEYRKFAESYGNEKDRAANIDELERFYDSYFAEEVNPAFQDFIQKLSLLDHSQEANKEKDIWEKRVFLTTVHGCKGLEFDVVFVAGLNEEIFPHYLSISVEEDLEEERRLFYVAVTRAKNFLYLSYPKRMSRHGIYEFYYKSRFLDELSPEKFEVEGGSQDPLKDLKDFKGFFGGG